MIMSPTRPMTLPILDFYWHVNVICFFHLTALQIFTCSGSSDVTRAHCVRKSRAFSPPPRTVWLLLLLWMTTDK